MEWLRNENDISIRAWGVIMWETLRNKLGLKPEQLQREFNSLFSELISNLFRYTSEEREHCTALLVTGQCLCSIRGQEITSALGKKRDPVAKKGRGRLKSFCYEIISGGWDIYD